MSDIVILHYIKLVYRSILFVAAFVVYVLNRIHNTGKAFSGWEDNHILLMCIWTVFLVEMILRCFPSKYESMGCQKQFARNYHSLLKEGETAKLNTAKTTFAVAAAWLTLNGIIGVLYFTGVIDAGVLLLISLAYSVCDIICILFFCPFQTWFMKNKCCGSCRIYNWDYAMMFTPLVFIKNAYTWTLLGLALLLLIKWEYTVHKYPERFTERSNKSLSCAMCQEKLCHHKVQLRTFLQKGKFETIGKILFNQDNKNM